MSCSGTLPKVGTYFHVVINMTAAGYLYSLDVTITQRAINKQGIYSSVVYNIIAYGVVLSSGLHNW